MKAVVGSVFLLASGLVFWGAVGMAVFALGGPILLGAFVVAGIAVGLAAVAEFLLC